jgi:K+ transporter
MRSQISTVLGIVWGPVGTLDIYSVEYVQWGPVGPQISTVLSILSGALWGLRYLQC